MEEAVHWNGESFRHPPRATILFHDEDKPQMQKLTTVDYS